MKNQIVEALVKYWEYMMKHMDGYFSNDVESKKNLFDCAFGATDFVCCTYPEHAQEVADLWEEWREKFVEKVYGNP